MLSNSGFKAGMRVKILSPPSKKFSERIFHPLEDHIGTVNSLVYQKKDKRGNVKAKRLVCADLLKTRHWLFIVYTESF